MKRESRSFIRSLLQIEVLFTVCPAICLPAMALALGAVFPAGGIVMLHLLFLFMLPAFMIVNGLGYRTVEGAPPLPLPAGSITSLLILLGTHALLVAAVFTVWRIGSLAIRLGRRKHSG